jgi:hypothetical protein
MCDQRECSPRTQLEAVSSFPRVWRLGQRSCPSWLAKRHNCRTHCTANEPMLSASPQRVSKLWPQLQLVRSRAAGRTFEHGLATCGFRSVCCARLSRIIVEALLRTLFPCWQVPVRRSTRVPALVSCLSRAPSRSQIMRNRHDRDIDSPQGNSKADLRQAVGRVALLSRQSGRFAARSCRQSACMSPCLGISTGRTKNPSGQCDRRALLHSSAQSPHYISQLVEKISCATALALLTCSLTPILLQ